jgi:CBS domain-containing protein
MRCEELMTPPPEILDPAESSRQAARKMHELEVGFLPVCGPDRTVLGTLTDRDLVRRIIAEGRPHDTPVSQVMSADVAACRPDDDVEHAAALMRDTQRTRILCIDDAGLLAGIINLSDLTVYEDETRAARTMTGATRREINLR